VLLAAYSGKVITNYHYINSLKTVDLDSYVTEEEVKKEQQKEQKFV